MDYYHRTIAQNTDGSPIFANAADRASEEETRRLLSEAWKCEVKSFGKLSPVDFYAVRHGQMIGVMELKTRSHASSDYQTVMLNVRKWGSLMLYHFGLGCPALFIVRFTDAYRWINVTQIDASKWTIGGTRQIVKSHTDIEPVILVPIADMQELVDPTKVVF